MERDSLHSGGRWLAASIYGLALFGAIVVAETVFRAAFISETPVFGMIYIVAPFLLCLLISFGAAIWIGRMSVGLAVPFLVTIACLLVQRVNMHFRYSAFDERFVFDFASLMVMAGDLLGVLLGWAIASCVMRFRIVRRSEH